MINRYPNAVSVSSKTRLGFERLHSIVSDALSRSFQDVDIEMHVGNGKLLAYIAAKGEILSTQYSEDLVTVHCRIPQKYLGRIDPTDTIITPHSAAGWINEDEEKNGSDSAADQPAISTNIDVTAAFQPKQPNGAFLTPARPPQPAGSIEPELPLDDAKS